MTIHKTLIALALIAGMLMTSCNDYLDIKPKGDKIPETLTDYEALLRGETMLNPIAYMPVLQALYLMNDAQRNKMMLNTKNLTTANYMWDESADRIALNSGSEQFLDFTYSGIACCNLILDGVPQVSGCDENERRELNSICQNNTCVQLPDACQLLCRHLFGIDGFRHTRSPGDTVIGSQRSSRADDCRSHI